MSKLVNYYLSILVLIFSKDILHPCEGLFEYICEEKQLFKPYVHVYRGRKGERVLEKGPGFYLMTQEQDIYVCVNGPAYLYFARTTELGQVYEAPQPHVYSHTCEMYNVKPHSKATKIEYELHLMAVLLYGDANDYRRPAIQRFTAPYYFEKDEYRKDFPAHYQNATSVAVIGESECILEKGDKTPKIPIVIHPVWPAATAPATPTTPPDGERPEKDEYLCRLGFTEQLKTAAKASTDEESPEKKKMRLMVNDEPIRVQKCPTYVYSEPEFKAQLKMLTDDYEKLTTKWGDAAAVASRVKPFNDALDEKVAKYENEIKEIEKLIAKTPPPPPSTIDRHNKAIAAKKELIELETAKKKSTEEFITQVTTAVTAPKAEIDKIDALTTTAQTELTALEKSQADLKALEEAAIPDPVAILAAKTALYAAETPAYTAAKAAFEALSAATIAYSKADVLVDEAEARLVYKPSKVPPKKPKLVYSDRTVPDKIDIENTFCEKLPRRTGPEGECIKGKPDGEKACELFKITLGKQESWPDPAATDSWKKEVVELVGGIFINACPYLANRRKFVKIISMILGYYLNSNDHFNQPSTAGTSDSCRAFHNWKLDPFAKPSVVPPVPVTDANKSQREFWKTIIEVLKECQTARRSLTFVDTSPTYGKWVWIKPDANKTQMTIEPYREQAEKEYVFNWVIDMSWRIFATALGICMPGYEEKNPLITSRFYSMFTEDFLIPLRETWINSKDNLVFQWILGEFYNGDAENWSELCMEASYFYAEREDYRPLRSLLVNCASEHNYFITGKFVGYSGKYVGLGR